MQLAADGLSGRARRAPARHATPDAIDQAEDRQLFKDTMREASASRSSPPRSSNDRGRRAGRCRGHRLPRHRAPGLHAGRRRRRHRRRPRTSCARSRRTVCDLSPITQILVEKCISGWKEIEFEVMRDARGQRHHRLQHGEPRPRRRPHRRLHRRRARPVTLVR